MKRVFLPCLLLVALVLPALAQPATVVSSRRGTLKEDARLKITKDSYEGVQGKRGPATMSFKAPDVVEIRWTSQPTEYKKAWSSYRDGDYSGAAQSFQMALEKSGKSKSYPWLASYANYYLGKSLNRMQKGAAAMAAFKASLASNPKSRFAPDIHFTMAEIYLSAAGGKNMAGAKKELQVLSGLSKYDSSYEVQAEHGLAKVEIQSGSATAALGRLDRLMGRASSDTQRNLLRSTKGQALISMKRYAEAEKAFSTILDSKKGTSPEVIALAANGLGDSQFAQDKYKEAAESYSRTYALFYDREDLRNDVGWALYRGGESFQRVAGAAKGDERKQFEKYGKSVLNRAAKGKEFKNTPGGQAARKKLGLK